MRDDSVISKIPVPPVWPLPSDWKKANADLKDQTWASKCVHCGVWLRLPPADVGALGRHHKSTACAKGTEMKQMHEEGFHVLNGKHQAQIASLVRHGKYYKYLPSPVASYMRWLDRFLSNSKQAHSELAWFLALTDEEKTNHLSGLVLQYEFAKEQGVVSATRY